MCATSPWDESNSRALATTPMPTLTISHLTSVVLFALFASTVFAITLREGMREQVRYGVICFAWFLGGTIAGGWLLFLINRH